MATLEFVTTQGERNAIPTDAVEEFQGGFRGRLIAPDDNGFESARKIWNGTIDRRPGLIAECTGPADVVAAVNFASRNDVPPQPS